MTARGTPVTDDEEGGGHVGPIIFGNETACQQLTEVGEVVTFRTSERTVGKTWWRMSRTGSKQGDVVVDKLRAVDPRDPFELRPSVHLSGFESVEAWQDAISELNGGELPPVGILYRARTTDDQEASDAE